LVDTVALLTDASERLIESARGLDARDLGEATALPGWTRAHVVTHLARNADGLRNLLLAARSGEVVRMYASLTARAADIEAGVSRPADVIVADAVQSTKRFLVEARAMPASAWTNEVLFTSGQPDPPAIEASELLRMRLEEVIIHHVDLGVDFEFADVDIDSVAVLVGRYARRYEARGIDLTGIEGSADAMLGWLSHRGTTEGLLSDNGVIPELPVLG
jgi:maleylpyruvate isomerase